MARAMLLGGFRFGAVNLQSALDPATPPVLALALALAGTTHPPAAVQSLVDYMRASGHLLPAGRVPALDMARGPCPVLRDALG
ncbi:MAG: hypothetical protein GEV28_05575 [Actinophytocola sp.]|uniref:hypothetical protein n=1 Tax=Actinophytocola sp. TaxID=1872138 RepID=UPI0013228879|nr:hypothetical protein [Actinophytocola sp.]MPZ79883.1 hypothetical protein [Actinophytocola sp.]